MSSQEPQHHVHPVAVPGGSASPDAIADGSKHAGPRPARESPPEPPSPTTARILIVDDDARIARYLERLLRRVGYGDIHATTRSAEAVALFLALEPDLVIVDAHMPEPDGFAVLEQLRTLVPLGAYLPVLMLTGDLSGEVRNRALALGARDFLTKPFDAVEAVYRIRNLSETRLLYRSLERQNADLDRRVEERTRALRRADLEMLSRLAQAGELRDDDTGRHTHRVGVISALLARAVGLEERLVEAIRRAAPLHDLGKIGIPDGILLKAGPLTPSEFAVMTTHTTIGARLLSGGGSELLALAEQIALSHHERWDGAGYPRGLAGEAIPLPARIVAVSDVYDALSHPRPYRPAWPRQDVVDLIARERGRQFDATIAEALLDLHADGALAPLEERPQRGRPDAESPPS